MKINPISNPNILRSYQASKATPIKNRVASGRDEVVFSEEALSFAKVMTEVETRTQEERAHIASVTNAVRQGDYKIDSDKIADKILDSVLRRP
ncbi:MAG: flagellar biosynthesis anti-sigma factor FlgM [Oscillospiraceae bacterium]|nr:flagellar biosynthesis anti-sigma factor FlgM [Oscillospiraceae bacterium]MCL2126113.1 flagellar biosynthesis anti-sigma factor FlgM [Oscillospiraceae bacterium]